MTQPLVAAPSPVPPGVVLVVDDTDSNRYAAARWLEKAGYRVVMASTGAEALERATSDVELVVLDVHLPDLHGFEVTRKLKSDATTSHLPVLHMSAKHVSLHDRVHGLEGGADGYLVQPVDPAELVAHVGAMLRVSRAERALRERNLELEAANRDAVRARDVAERVLGLAFTLTSAVAPRGAAEAVVCAVPSLFGAVGAVIARRVGESATLEVLAASAMRDDLRAEWQEFPLDAPAPLAEVARDGEPIFLESREDWAARFPAIVPALDASGHHANAVVPLIVDRRVIGSLGIAFAEPHVFTSEERALLQSTAQHAALALERTRLLGVERTSRQEAESANRAKSEFLATMSHELRTPLNAIGGYADLMELGIQGPITAEQAVSITRIKRSQRHLLGLINGVLNYARVESGHVHYEVGDVAMDDVLAMCETLVAPQARDRKLALVFDGCAAGLTARGDAEKVQQVVLNLLSNAVKFTEPGGRVTLECGLECGERELVFVRVSDTGSGIDATQLERIFEPFVQLDYPLTRQREGTGLGLAISRDLARGMFGDLTVTSQLGVGSTFTLTLPRV